jgi:translation initiation factor IF-2
MELADDSQLKTQNLLPRPPIVVILGHVDHGKTTLLSYIRKTKMPKEPGEITQSIGAYEIIHNGQKITFIDTPGHKAFSKMRQRGAKVADLGILVVAADEGVKPQTKEAIETLQESKTPFIVAINKIDKPNADIEKTKQELMQAGVLLEGFGGNISWQAISAKTGQGIDELLDLILLAAEVEQLTYNPEAKAKGVIIESKMDSRRGLTAAAIVRDGILRVGDEIATSSAIGKIKILENFLGERVSELSPSSPALILGFENLPQIGEEFFSGKVELAEIKPVSREIPEISAQTGEDSRINFILKTDVSGSLEALSEIVKTLPGVKIISQSVGDITDGDVKSALNTNAIIVGFKVRVSKAAENLATAQGIKIITSEIIYELLKNLEDEFRAIEKPATAGQLEILAIFGKKSGSARGGRQVIGGRVILGTFKNNLSVQIQRQGRVIGEGKIINLQCRKQDVSQVSEEKECGLLFESDTIINIGDLLIF